MFVYYVLGVIILIADWIIYKKMGRKGWESIIPFYNLYVLCKELYDNGWKFLLFLIPFYNIYFYFKLNIDLANKFNQDFGFGIGLALIPFMFKSMLALGNYQCDGINPTTIEDDIVINAVNKTKEYVNNLGKKPNENEENYEEDVNYSTGYNEEYNDDYQDKTKQKENTSSLNSTEILATIEKLNEMKNNGVITNEEFEVKKEELLKRL